MPARRKLRSTRLRTISPSWSEKTWEISGCGVFITSFGSRCVLKMALIAATSLVVLSVISSETESRGVQRYSALSKSFSRVGTIMDRSSIRSRTRAASMSPQTMTACGFR